MKIAWGKFGQDVLASRQAKGLSVRDMAKRAKVTHATFSRAERGLTVSAETFIILSSYMLDKDPRTYLR